MHCDLLCITSQLAKRDFSILCPLLNPTVNLLERSLPHKFRVALFERRCCDFAMPLQIVAVRTVHTLTVRFEHAVQILVLIQMRQSVNSSLVTFMDETMMLALKGVTSAKAGPYFACAAKQSVCHRPIEEYAGALGSQKPSRKRMDLTLRWKSIQGGSCHDSKRMMIGILREHAERQLLWRA